jgi:hypothetical protein
MTSRFAQSTKPEALRFGFPAHLIDTRVRASGIPCYFPILHRPGPNLGTDLEEAELLSIVEDWSKSAPCGVEAAREYTSASSRPQPQ